MKLSQKTGINEIVLKEICDIAKKCDVQKVQLFGSRARGDFKSKSDIDLAVLGGDGMMFSLLVEEETTTLLEYDIVILDQPVQKPLLESIEREGVSIYEKV